MPSAGKALTVFLCFLSLLILPAIPGLAQGETRVLLVACREFETMPALGESVSGNLSLLRSTFLCSGIDETDIRLEDGTLGTISALEECLTETFRDALPDDLSILYLCTHGIDREGNTPAHLILSDGNREEMLTPSVLFDLLSPFSGNVLVLIDACYSGAFIGRGIDETPCPLPENIHVLTSSLGTESAWYYSHDQMSSGAISYFTNAVCSGLGLYGQLSADTDGDGDISLWELTLWIRRTVASSTCQSASSCAHTLMLPHCEDSPESKPISGFSCGSQLISNSNATFHFSFHVSRDAYIEYHLIPYEDNHWNWANPIVIPDSESPETGRGGKTRTLSIAPANRENSGYLIFQIFAYEEDGTPQLCAERLLAIQSENDTADDFSLSTLPASEALPGNLPVLMALPVPTIFRISIYNETGTEVRRLYYGELTRPAREDIQYLSWDMLDDQGQPVPPGEYIIEAMALFFGSRAEKQVQISIR